MGRRAKYLTLDERKAGARARHREYAATAHCQKLRAAQNHRAYKARVPSAILTGFRIPTLSDELFALADDPLSNSRIFQQALRSSDALEDTDYADSQLAEWNNLSRLASPSPEHPHLLLDALQGYRMRLLRESEDRRLQRYESLALEEFLAEVHAEMMAHYRQWTEIRDMMEHLPLGFGADMGQGMLHWEARRVCHLKDDLIALSKGSDAFLGVYVNRWS